MDDDELSGWTNSRKWGCLIIVLAIFLIFFGVLWATCGSTIDTFIEAIP